VIRGIGNNNMVKNVANARAGGMTGTQGLVGIVLMENGRGCIVRQKFAGDVPSEVNSKVVPPGVGIASIAFVGSGPLGKRSNEGWPRNGLQAKDGAPEATEMLGVSDRTIRFVVEAQMLI